MSFLTTNWKTTAGGIVLIGLALCKVFGINVAGISLPDLPTALTAGLALIFASDATTPPAA
jgi:hypothetical protein